MKNNAIKNLFIFLFVFCFVSGVSAQETITLTTYYPSPFGVYQQLEVGQTLTIQPSGDPGCTTAGLMYYHAGEGLRICDGADWTGSAGVWRKGFGLNTLYPLNLGWSVGVGTSTPTSILEVEGDLEISGANRAILMGRDLDAGPFGFEFANGEAALFYQTGPNQVIVENAGGDDIFRVDVDDNHAAFAGFVGVGTSAAVPTSALDVTGNAQVSGTSTLTGAATLQATLDVTGATTLNSTLNTIGATTLSNTLNVTGVSTFTADVNITGANDLSVQGLSTLAGLVSIGGGAADCAGCDLDVVGSIEAGSFWYPSDENLKENIHPISGLANIKKLKGVRYTWKESGESDLGITAQNVEEVFPEIVNTNSANGLKSVKADRIIAPLIEAVKEQQQMIEAQQKEINQLRSEMQALQQNTF